MQQQEQGSQMAVLRLRYLLEITVNGGSQALTIYVVLMGNEGAPR